jgi:pimeloyl-[acyl-carrier protein] methyl ester esterase
MTLHVESVGRGPPLVLLHGFGLHGGLFSPMLPALAGRHRVHVVDLPGHGHSPAIAPYTLDAIVDAVDAAIAPLAGDAPLSMLGWSFGGLVAQRYAARVRAPLARLALVCTSPRFVNGEGWSAGIDAAVLRRFGDELRVAYAPTLRRFVALQMQGADGARATLAQLRALLASRPPADASAVDAALAILGGTDLRDAAATLRVPTLVVAGGRDTLAPAAAGRWLAATIPGAALAVIEAAAHVPFLSHPRAFEAALAPHIDARAA